MVLRPNDFETSYPFLRTFLNSAAELVPVVVELVLLVVAVEPVYNVNVKYFPEVEISYQPKNLTFRVKKLPNTGV